MNKDVTFETMEEYLQSVKNWKSSRRLHSIVEERLTLLLSRLYPDSYSTQEVIGVLGGRNDLMQFFFNRRRVVFELFFSPSQVPQDLRLLEQSTADVRIAVLLDQEVNPKLAHEYFHKKPEHFPYLWLKQVMVPKYERFCLARLRELIDEDSAINRMRRVLSTPAGSKVEQYLGEQLERIETDLQLRQPKPIRPEDLTGHQLAALLAVSQIIKMGVPRERLRSLYVWLQEAISFAFELVLLGFQAFLITELDEHHAIWSDGDLADDLILGAEYRTQANVVICLNNIVNDVLAVFEHERTPLRWHFFHTYKEHISKIIPVWEMNEDNSEEQ